MVLHALNYSFAWFIGYVSFAPSTTAITTNIINVPAVFYRPFDISGTATIFVFLVVALFPSKNATFLSSSMFVTEEDLLS